MTYSRLTAVLAAGLSLASAGIIQAGDEMYPPVVQLSRSNCYELEAQLCRRQVLDYQIGTLTMRQESVGEGLHKPPDYWIWLDDTVLRRSDKSLRGGMRIPDWGLYPAGTKRFIEYRVKIYTPGVHTIKVQLVESKLPLVDKEDHPECTATVLFPVTVPAPNLSPDDAELLRLWKVWLKQEGISAKDVTIERGRTGDSKHTFSQWYDSRMHALRKAWLDTHPDATWDETIYWLVEERPMEVRSSYFGYRKRKTPGFAGETVGV